MLNVLFTPQPGCASSCSLARLGRLLQQASASAPSAQLHPVTAWAGTREVGSPPPTFGNAGASDGLCSSTFQPPFPIPRLHRQTIARVSSSAHSSAPAASVPEKRETPTDTLVAFRSRAIFRPPRISPGRLFVTPYQTHFEPPASF
ncbi:hypothetical protein FALBO_13783 [Fusarium albosuccineum]|uniref:Uncharacterized protein n=1 Tax=Fusarium albosuccineum TaxID=1237068 RepID=A0A8H4KZA5_9HYPO|nr:hypothetical protein FALBO_13783 [Fusarium albosuccineum]